MSADGQRTIWRRNIAENFNRLSRVHQRYRQTTDGRTMTYRERELEFTFAKNRQEFWPKLNTKFAISLYKGHCRHQSDNKVLHIRAHGIVHSSWPLTISLTSGFIDQYATVCRLAWTYDSNISLNTFVWPLKLNPSQFVVPLPNF